MTLSDLERRDARGQIFQADLYHFAHVLLRKMTKIGTVTQVGE